MRRYRPQVYGWCLKWGLQGADADDVTQQVLVKLIETMRTFRYDPARRFRAWRLKRQNSGPRGCALEWRTAGDSRD